MTLNTLAAILAHQFAGNFADDSVAFGQIEAFCRNRMNYNADRLAAYNHMAVEGMGGDPATLEEMEYELDLIDTYVRP